MEGKASAGDTGQQDTRIETQAWAQGGAEGGGPEWWWRRARLVTDGQRVDGGVREDCWLALAEVFAEDEMVTKDKSGCNSRRCAVCV